MGGGRIRSHQQLTPDEVIEARVAILRTHVYGKIAAQSGEIYSSGEEVKHDVEAILIPGQAQNCGEAVEALRKRYEIKEET